MKNKQSKDVLMKEKGCKKIVVLFVWMGWMVQNIYAQDLTYFVLDTASSYNIIKMTAKNEISILFLTIEKGNEKSIYIFICFVCINLMASM